jgi:signal transduction histidine kinase
VVRFNLLTRLLMLVAVAGVPALIVLLFLQHDLRVDSRAHLADDARSQAVLLNADMTSVVEAARELGVALSHVGPVKTLGANCPALLQEVLSDLPAYAFLAVYRSDGTPACSTEPAPARPELAGTVAEALASKRFTVGTYLPAMGTRGAAVGFGLPFDPGAGRPGQVAVVGLSLEWLTNHLSDIRRPPRGNITVADRNGITLAHFPGQADLVGTRLPERMRSLVGSAAPGTAMVTAEDGPEQLVGFVPAGPTPTGLFVSVAFEMPQMMAAIDDATVRGYLMVVLGALLSLWLAVMVGERFIRRPTALLLEAALRWSSGDLSARANLTERPQTEFGSLAVAFNGMAEALGRQRAELRDLNATLEARVEERTADLVDSRNRLQVEMAERERAESSLRQAQKLQAVGQLAGGVAHDFNNLLTAIMGALDLLRIRLNAGPQELQRHAQDLPRLVDGAMHAAERGGKLTSQLLAFSRRQSLRPVSTDLNGIVGTLRGLLAVTLGRGVEVRVALAPDLWPAMVDPAQVESAVFNLAINARDAMPENGVLTISTNNLTLDPESDLSCAHEPVVHGCVPGDFVAVSVADNGSGMSPEVLARVFEPFFTTKGPGRGSGLGLSQVHGLAVQSGGDVRIRSRVGEGTTVCLLLPRAEAEPVLVHRLGQRQGQVGDAPQQAVRVLVVDDDGAVRQMIGEMLSELGYVATLAADGAEALALLQEDDSREQRFQILLADYAMPGMNGLALIRAATTGRPWLRVLLATGYAEFRQGEEIPPSCLMRKPFTIAALDERLQSLMAAGVCQPPAGISPERGRAPPCHGVHSAPADAA